MKGVKSVKEIHYWGHFPVADLEFETDAPVSVGLRAWAPFIPGDTITSNTPGAVFEVHLRNTSATAHGEPWHSLSQARRSKRHRFRHRFLVRKSIS